jgi:hypothetical protein
MPSGVTHTQGCLLFSISFVHWQVEVKMQPELSLSMPFIPCLARFTCGISEGEIGTWLMKILLKSPALFSCVTAPPMHQIPEEVAISSQMVAAWGRQIFASFCIFSTPHFECKLQSFPKDSQLLPQYQ